MKTLLPTPEHMTTMTLGWFSLASRKADGFLYLACRRMVWAMIRALMLSHARTAIIPMQDLLEKGGEARFNYPSSCNDRNWSWQVEGRAH